MSQAELCRSVWLVPKLGNVHDAKLTAILVSTQGLGMSLVLEPLPTLCKGPRFNSLHHHHNKQIEGKGCFSPFCAVHLCT